MEATGERRDYTAPLVLVLFGAPGVGKGTQAQILAEKLGIAHLSTGDAFRTAIANQTAVGKQVQRYVESGALVPDELVSQIVAEELQKPQYRSGVVLDGFPRTIAQAQALEKILSDLGMSVTAVINLVVPEDVIIDRLVKRGRKDDRPDIIRHRLEVYHKETAPLLQYYQEHSTIPVITIDGNADIETVNQRILSAIKSRIRSDAQP